MFTICPTGTELPVMVEGYGLALPLEGIVMGFVFVKFRSMVAAAQ
jgi:hypothetical protein